MMPLCVLDYSQRLDHTVLAMCEAFVISHTSPDYDTSRTGFDTSILIKKTATLCCSSSIHTLAISVNLLKWILVFELLTALAIWTAGPTLSVAGVRSVWQLGKKALS